jgi:hypothetical protein
MDRGIQHTRLIGAVIARLGQIQFSTDDGIIRDLRIDAFNAYLEPHSLGGWSYDGEAFSATNVPKWLWKSEIIFSVTFELPGLQLSTQPDVSIKSRVRMHAYLPSLEATAKSENPRWTTQETEFFMETGIAYLLLPELVMDLSNFSQLSYRYSKIAFFDQRARTVLRMQTNDPYRYTVEDMKSAKRVRKHIPKLPERRLRYRRR